MKTTTWLHSLLVPIARLCVRRGLSIQDVIDAAKSAFVLAAQEELAAADEKPSVSRLSAITGLQRKDISQRLNIEETKPGALPSGLTGRVVHTWLSEQPYCSKSMKPRKLPLDGPKSFYALVRRISTDVHPAAVLKELHRLEMVTADDDGSLTLGVTAFIPSRSVHEAERLLALDLNDLTSAVEGNMSAQGAMPNLHARTEFDFVDPAAIAKLRSWMFARAKKLHGEARQEFAKYDKDCTPTLKFTGRARIAFSTFSFSEQDSFASDYQRASTSSLSTGSQRGLK